MSILLLITVYTWIKGNTAVSSEFQLVTIPYYHAFVWLGNAALKHAGGKHMEIYEAFQLFYKIV